jgi:hypothetical protein
MENIQPKIKENLVSGFHACGIYPMNVEELLKRIPRESCDVNAIETLLIQALEKKRADWTEVKILDERGN